jgi:hypothetical protein
MQRDFKAGSNVVMSPRLDVPRPARLVSVERGPSVETPRADPFAFADRERADLAARNLIALALVQDPPFPYRSPGVETESA